MSRPLVPFAALGLALVLHPAAAAAYIGPGLGAGAVASVLGVLGAIFLGIVGVVYYPIKRMLKRRKAAPAATVTDEPAD